MVLPRTLGNDFHASLLAGTKAGALEQNVNLVVEAAPTEDDYAFQERHLQRVLSNDVAVDGVIIEPGHSTLLLEALQLLGRQGIPFIVVDNPLVRPSDMTLASYCGFIGTDNRRGGSLAAEYVGETLRKGKVLLIRGIMSHRTSQDRESGFLSAIKHYPTINIAQVIEGKWSYEETERVLRHFTKPELSSVDAVFAYNDLMALGAASVFHRHSLRPLIVGYDGILEAQTAIIDGNIDATVAQAPETMGKRAVAKLRSCIEQKSYTGDTELTHVTLLKATRTLTAVSSYGTD